MTTPSRTPGGDTPNERTRQPGRDLPPGNWNRQTDEPAAPRGSDTAVSQADGHP